MNKLTKIFIFIFFPFFISAQSNTFRSNMDEKLLDDFFILNKKYSDPSQDLKIGQRFFALSSFTNKNEISNTYLLGLSFRAKIKKKVLLNVFYDHLYGNHHSEIKRYQDSLSIYYPSFGLNNTRLQLNAKYLANKFISVDIGQGKQFIGDGYQSLLLSDIGSHYPYIKITTQFGPIKYYNLYTTFLNSNMIDYGRKKHATIHYLDFAITKKINIGIFESILWQSKSEEGYTGYEFAYINPIIFYRPVEFSMGSSKGNALMGVNFNSRFKTVILYGQFMLDDLNISRQKDRDENYEEGFFQNKYGYQLGLKFKKKDIKFLIEFNQVQPYTYGHRTILQNYSHINQALAHPLGANFKELINILEIKKGKWTYKIKTMFTNVGLDSLNTHYGQNIFESDLEASNGGQHSYGNFNGQGIITTSLSFQSEVSFKFKGFDLFSSFYYRTKKSDLLDQTLLFYSLGLRTFPFSYFQDY